MTSFLLRVCLILPKKSTTFEPLGMYLVTDRSINLSIYVFCSGVLLQFEGFCNALKVPHLACVVDLVAEGSRECRQTHVKSTTSTDQHIDVSVYLIYPYVYTSIYSCLSIGLSTCCLSIDLSICQSIFVSYLQPTYLDILSM